MRILLSFLFVLLAAGILFAQDAPLPEPTSIIAPDKTDITTRIHLLIDVSGSMNTAELNAAITMAIRVSQQPIDELNIAITVFANGFTRMQIVDEESEIGPNWMCLPSQEHIDSIFEFLNNHGLARGHTNVYGAMQAAIDEDVDDVCYMIISDCDISDIHRIAELDLNGPLGFIGINGPSNSENPIVQTIDTLGGWYMNVELSAAGPW